MNPASGWRRFSSFLTDFTFMLFCYFMSYKSIELLMPGKELYPPPKGMQLFTGYEFHLFAYTFLSILALNILYSLIIHSLCKSQSIGMRLNSIQRQSSISKEITWTQKIMLVLTTVMKIVLILLPGPAVAFFQVGGMAVSVLLLLVAIYLLVINPLLTYRTTHKKSWVEKITQTKLIEH